MRQPLPGLLHIGHIFLGRAQLFQHLIEAGFRVGKFLLIFSAALQLHIDCGDFAFQYAHILGEGDAAVAGVLLEERPLLEAKNACQHRLAVARRFDREFVRTALSDKSRIHESLVIYAQQCVDFALRLADAGFGVTAPALSVRIVQLQFQQALPALAAFALPHHLIALPGKLKGEGHAHLALAEVNQFVVAALTIARPTPQRPDHGFQQRRFAGPVFARETCYVDTAKIKRGGILVRQKIGDF